MSDIIDKPIQPEDPRFLEGSESLFRATTVSKEALRALPTTARPIVDAADVKVPEGYTVEAVVAGLSFPCGMTTADDGTVFIAEGGTVWPTRPWMPSRLLRIETDGTVKVLAREAEGGLRGIAWRDGFIYATAKGGYKTRLLRFDAETGEREVLLNTMPDGGWHEPGGPVFGPDGLIYFAQGSVSQQGVIEPGGFTVDIARHPDAHDVPGADVTLTGENVWSYDPVIPYADMRETGAFKPYGTPARKGEVVKGEMWCSSGVWRAKPDGSEPELLAWGIRNPYGMAINEEGELYVADNDLEEKGNRAVGEDPDRIWHVKDAKLPHGAVKEPKWFGFPDRCADGLPVWDEKHKPNRGTPAKQLIATELPYAGAAPIQFPPHTCMCKMDFSKTDAFGARGKLFACLWGTYAPLNTIRPEALNNGFCVAEVNVEDGSWKPFVSNQQPGPARKTQGSGGIERPVDCKFTHDGKSLYVLDFGTCGVMKYGVIAYAHTGVLWRITKQ